MTAEKAPAKKARGGQPGNRNALRNGLRSSRGFGKPYDDRAAGIFRRATEDDVLALCGEITLRASALIDTATKAVRVALAFQRVLENPALTVAEQVAVGGAILKANKDRDAALAALGLPINRREKRNLADLLYADAEAPEKLPAQSGPKVEQTTLADSGRERKEAGGLPVDVSPVVIEEHA